jgi:hypothetical protein
VAYFKINASLETFCSSASGWVLDRILKIEQTIFLYRPLGGGSGDFVFPQELTKRGLISVTGRLASDRDCFIWSVVASIHRGSIPRQSPYLHWTSLKEDRKWYIFTEAMCENLAVTLEQVPSFEKLNVSVNVFAFEDGIVFPLYVSKVENYIEGRHANLLLVHTEDPKDPESVSKHYCAITDLGKLVQRQQKGNHKLRVCPRCLQIKYSDSDLRDLLRARRNEKEKPATNL